MPAFPCAEAAADAGVGYAEMRSLPGISVIQRLSDHPGEIGGRRPHLPACDLLVDLALHLCNLLLAAFEDAADMLMIREIEDRRPGVRHLDIEAGIEGKAFPTHDAVCHGSRGATGRSIGRDIEEIGFFSNRSSSCASNSDTIEGKVQS